MFFITRCVYMCDSVCDTRPYTFDVLWTGNDLRNLYIYMEFLYNLLTVLNSTPHHYKS